METETLFKALIPMITHPLSSLNPTLMKRLILIHSLKIRHYQTMLFTLYVVLLLLYYLRGRALSLKDNKISKNLKSLTFYHYQLYLSASYGL